MQPFYLKKCRECEHEYNCACPISYRENKGPYTVLDRCGYCHLNELIKSIQHWTRFMEPPINYLTRKRCEERIEKEQARYEPIRQLVGRSECLRCPLYSRCITVESFPVND